MPLLSVIIPVYNVEKYLKQCVDSVINQNLTDIEVLLVDDGSPDNSPAICDEYAQKYEFIKAIHKENGGLSSARNCGIENASGEYIIFMDSDDWWNPEVNVGRILEEVKAKNQVDMFLFLALDYVEGEGLFKRVEYNSINEIKNYSINEYYDFLVKNSNFEVSACTKILKKSFLCDNNLMFKKGLLGEDNEWMMRVLRELKEVEIIPEPLYICRLRRKDSITNTVGIKNICDLLGIVEGSIEYYKGDNVKNMSLKDFEMSFASYLWFCALGLCHNLNKEEIAKVKPLFKKTDEVCKYSLSKKTKLSKVAYRCFGFKGAVKILGSYIKTKSRFNLRKSKI